MDLCNGTWDEVIARSDGVQLLVFQNFPDYWGPLFKLNYRCCLLWVTTKAEPIAITKLASLHSFQNSIRWELCKALRCNGGVFIFANASIESKQRFSIHAAASILLKALSNRSSLDVFIKVFRNESMVAAFWQYDQEQTLLKNMIFWFIHHQVALLLLGVV